MNVAKYKLTFSQFITERWYVVILAWLVLAGVLRLVAPSWGEVAADGDLQFLPADSPNVVGSQQLDAAFPGQQTRSRMVLVAANIKDQPIDDGSVAFAMDAARRLHWFAANTAWRMLDQSSAEFIGTRVENAEQRRTFLAEIAQDNIEAAISIDDELARYLGSEHPDFPFARIDGSYQLRSQIMRVIQPDSEQAAQDSETADILAQQAAEGVTKLLSLPTPTWAMPIREVWTWRDAVIGHKLIHPEKHARLITLQLDTDFTATSNMEIVRGLDELTSELRKQYAGIVSEDLHLGVTGSAAIGADMLKAAASGVRMTELVTVILVLTILTIVYRAPLLVAIPLASIALSLVVAISLIALIARSPGDIAGNGLQVFTTTRIFIVVILFGAGTDFCLFFLARNRELLASRCVNSSKQTRHIVGRAWLSVHDALVASALTTMIGLGLMWFSDFAKFRYSGPVIAISLGVTLCVCLTFTPALCASLGRIAYWPAVPKSRELGKPRKRNRHAGGRFWLFVSRLVVARPRTALLLGGITLALPAAFGVWIQGKVTYDLTEELSRSAPSRQGQLLVERFFPSQEASPITFLATLVEPLEDDDELRAACVEFAEKLYVDGVQAVRHVGDPLGDYPPGRRKGMFDKDAWRLRILRSHRLTREKYISGVGNLEHRVARFEVVIEPSVFSTDASSVLDNLKVAIDQEVNDASSTWFGAGISETGTVVGINDLRQVTHADQNRIQVLVTLGVWAVLVVMLRRPVLSVYLIATVLLSYFSTIGITYFVFSTLYGPEYGGLDWKVPLFVFVILVAVGQDYNVYLVTRIFEEQQKLGHAEGIRRAVHLTGGIITSCGLVMAGTFIAMTSPAVYAILADWLPEGWLSEDTFVLRGITELGFALSCGVMLDTIVVRSILVPAFMTLRHKPELTAS